MFDLLLALIVAATSLNGILAGASLDQSIKQLPARHRIGAIAYSAYSRASDLGNGIAWYAAIGIGAALLSIAAAITSFFQDINATDELPLLFVYVAAALSILHTLITARAAPTNFSQRKHADDEAELRAIFDRFARLQAVRALLQLLAFGSLLSALVAYPG